ncbi:MAG: outer membrane beta-barrel protein [Bacteroidaceae bacterium]|nr:outer membrane beta-barrel protein [Bacteroidaceae bacterium]
MKKLLLSLMLSLLATAMMAQKYVVMGTIKNEAEGTALPYATASVLENDKVIAAMTSKTDGTFKLEVKKTGKFTLKVSYIGFDTKTQSITITDKTDTLRVGAIALAPREDMLGTALVTATAAKVEQKEDTTVFNASAYRVPEGSTLEALIKQLPGAEIDDNGKVKINGQEVTEFLINGKDFFKGDTDIAMKNLPTNLVSKIKSYKKKSDYTEMTGIDDGEETNVLDISTKRELNQTLVSNIDLAYGTKDRYSAKAFINYFTDHSRITVYGSANNINDRGYGGWGRGGGGVTASKEGGLDFSWENGKEKKEAGRVELGGNARYNHRTSHSLSTNSTETFLTSSSSTRSFSNGFSRSRNSSTNFNTSFRVRWNPDTMTMVMFRPSYSFSKGKGNSSNLSATFNDDPYEVDGGIIENPLDSIFKEPIGTVNPELLAIAVNRQHRESMNDNKSHNLSGTMNITRRIGNEGRNVSLRLNAGYSKSESNNYSLNEIMYFKGNATNSTSTFLNQYTTSPSKNYNYSARLSYSEPLGNNWFAEARYEYSHRYTDSDRSLFNLEEYDGGNSPWGNYTSAINIFGTVPSEGDLLMAVRDDYNSQYATYKYDDHNANIGVRYNTKEIRFNAGVDFKPQHTTMEYTRPGQIDTVVTRDVFNWAPNVRLRYRFNNTTNLDVNYRSSSSQPSMTNLLEVIDDSNPLSISMGNAGLKPSWNHNMNVDFRTYDTEAQRGIFAGVRGSMTQNSITNKSIYDTETGRNFSRPENINGNWNANGYFGFNTALGEAKLWNINTNTNVSYSNSVGYIGNRTTGIGEPPTDGAAALNFYHNVFNNIESIKATTNTLNLGERLRFGYRATYWDFNIFGNVNYQKSKSDVQDRANLETWNFDYGADLNINTDLGLRFSTDIRINSRRGYSSAEMNTNEVLWNAQISHSFLKGKAATLSLQFYDILREQSSISRNISAYQRTDSWTYGIHSYCMVHFIYKLNIFGGKKTEGSDSKKGGNPGGQSFGRGGMGGYGGGMGRF